MALKLGQYILDTYVERSKATGRLEMTFTVKVTRDNDQLKFDINPVEK